MCCFNIKVYVFYNSLIIVQFVNCIPREVKLKYMPEIEVSSQQFIDYHFKVCIGINNYFSVSKSTVKIGSKLYS